MYDVSGDPGTDSTVVLPVVLWRDLADCNLYLELPSAVTEADSPPTGASRKCLMSVTCRVFGRFPVLLTPCAISAELLPLAFPT